MPQIGAQLIQDKKKQIVRLHTLREDNREHWRELANFILPYRYVSLEAPDSDTKRRANMRNRYILDPAATKAAQVLGAGMLNGITSPARPWFRLRIANFEDELEHPLRLWLDEVVRRMLRVMAESNFYKALGTMYLELGVFGTAACIIYEDFDEVIRCYNSPLGEYYLQQDERGKVDTFARRIMWTVKQTVDRFGIENCSETVQNKYKGGMDGTKSDQLYDFVQIEHIIEPNKKPLGGRLRLPPTMKWRELYYETATTSGSTSTMPKTGMALGVKGFREYPCITPRWSTTANDVYGTDNPGMTALPDIIQLQHETKERGRILDTMARPPLVVDASMKGKPNSLIPGGVSYVNFAQNTNAGAKPAYQVNAPYGEITQDIQFIQERIREAFHNDLFNMISQLDTVRSATEIDARREEKLVLMGPVLSRFENEALDPAIKRIFSIMDRKGLLPEAPPELEDVELEVQYVSILADAQSAVSTTPIERYLAFTGEQAAVFQNVLDVPNAVELNRIYAERLGIPARGINSRRQVEENQASRAAAQQAAQATEQAAVAVDAAKGLSETDVGGGVNALQALIGSA